MVMFDYLLKRYDTLRWKYGNIIKIVHFLLFNLDLKLYNFSKKIFITCPSPCSGMILGNGSPPISWCVLFHDWSRVLIVHIHKCMYK